MAAETIQISTQNLTSQVYETQDISLVPSFEVNTSLSESSYIELFIYDNNQNILSSNYNFSQYTVLNDGQSPGSNGNISQIQLDPETILASSGFIQGEYITYFNFLNEQIGSQLQQLYISEISSDRTEIRLDSTVLSEFDIIDQTTTFVDFRENSDYFVDFYLNFGENQLAIANNIQLDDQDPTNPTILIKLYEALPENFGINSLLWVVTALEEPIAYQVTFQPDPIVIIDTVNLKGPNFNLDTKDQINNSTISLDYTTLTSTALTSSQNQLNSLLEEKEIDINIDYTDFNNFIHFSSAQTRLENFYYKVALIEQYSSSIAVLDGTTNNNPSSSLAVYESLINNIITNFDGYEYYLYYTSGSWAWPKTNSQPPYQLASPTSVAALSWYGDTTYGNPYYGGVILSASLFDNTNKDNLLFTIPEYLRNDPQNDPYQLFIEMVGQFYDNIWIYYKDVTEKYNADNRLEYGVSKDIVADAIRDFGIKLYQNNFSNDDLYTAFLGLTPQGGLFPFPNITGSLPTPSGFEYVDTLISASNDYMPLDDVNKSLYKRIYHNLPYLLKSKGTLPGLRALITSYGIPDTVLRINEYGGKDKSNTNDWDYWQNTFNYAYYNTGSNSININWSLTSSWNSANDVPSTLEFRFKVPDLSTISGSAAVDLWQTNTLAKIRLRYTGSGLATGSYSGSIVDPYYQYTHLDFFPDFSGNPTVSASVYLPFANEGWWSVMATRDGNNFKLCAGNSVYEDGENGTQLGFYATSTTTVSSTAWTTGTSVKFMPLGNEMYLQEIRYYNTVLSESVFKDYIMNPSSIEGNSLNSGPNELAFRASLGNELYTGSISIHPKVTGSWIATSSFTGGSNWNYNNTPTFVPNTEYFFYDQPVAGIKNAISDKIRIENSIIPTGSVLSPFRSLAQDLAISQSYTANTNLLEVAFSPQDEINDDIISQIGYFEIGELIGDPRLRSSSATSYPALDDLRNEYFEKYTKNYDLNDYIRLIKFFDNSLFKMIKDFVPARTSLASGVVIKQTLLERNKYPQPQTNINSTIAYTTSGSTNNVPFVFQNIEVSGTVAPQWNDYNPGTIENFSGGAGGVFNVYNTVTNTSQSWSESIITPSGSVVVLHNSQDEFYDGEFSGSVIVVTTQSLAQAYPLENLSFDYTPVRYSPQNYGFASDSIFGQQQFLNPLTVPSQGQILLLRPWRNLITNAPGPVFVKIHKFDNNGVDNTIPLGQLSQLLIKYSTFSSYSTMTILTINEYPTYYLYEVNNLGSNTADDYILDYRISGSITNTTTLFSGNDYALKYTASINPINLYTSSSGFITYTQTPNIRLDFTASLTGQSTTGTTSVELIVWDQSKTFLYTTTTATRVLTGSLYLLANNAVNAQATIGANDFTLTNFQFNITPFVVSSSAENDPIIIEPYITTPNYYNSDYNPLINNVLVDRLSTTHQDVDYSTGIATPTNFDLLISGSALKAAVQDSNYTSKRVILPRYNGSKSTSQVLNQWTPGDEGTYGKIPTVESLKTAVAYCDWIGGWPPEKMNASAIHVLYLIKSDGTVVIPNTSENSLADVKGNFETGENILISTKTVSAGQPQQSRKVIRGGTRIEPILYTQYGQSPASWNVTMSFTTDFISSQAFVGSYIAKSSPSTIAAINDASYAGVNMNNNILLGAQASAWTSNYYTINQNILDENVTLIAGGELKIGIITSALGAQNHNVTVRLIRERSGVKTVLATQTQTINQPDFYSGTSYSWGSNSIGYIYPIFQVSAAILPQDMLSGDRIYYDAVHTTSTYGESGNPSVSTVYVNQNDSYLFIGQSPAQTNTLVHSTGTNTLWGYPNNTKLYAITCSNSILNQLYNQGFLMVDVTGSGFNPITLEWNINYGDEFRFEGNENNAFVVKRIYDVNDFDSERVSSTGSVEVHFNTNLPSQSINLDHFVIRRYVDDASQIIMEGFKPIDSSGPYIVRPEYVVPELNKSVDQFILDLTQKGLIT